MSMAKFLCEHYICDTNWNYPDVKEREYYPDGSLKSGRYKDIEVTVSRKGDNDAQRTQTVFSDGKPVLIHINGKQATNPAFSWHHELAHIEEPEGYGPDPVKAELIADKTAIKRLGMNKKDYQKWLVTSDRSKDTPIHIRARTELHNNFAKYLEESYQRRNK
jgi:hypothetical protein